ncbi:heterokaryon incompatibility protein [Colletotrichum nymphaeae SA-01]|uniref:Heterokaryon incompatibility protein n=1 Tax=Colletotrichum nymphaeae SA-01 TaxID=1460502 RepID=A0A135ULN5_9PEZI|nr:heterokaryon incompatibility protein [Colletotrichum nymphaeae SA-01]
METSRRLNIRYLWIDSLCIIQHGDNFIDWKQESMHMDKIYSGSFVNISAADAPDANHSLFHDRNPDALCSQIVELPVGSQTNRFLLTDYYFWRTEVSSAVINTRAWVLQERLLSPRVLYFGQRQILWECHQKEDAEIYPDGLLIDLSRFPNRFKGFCHNQLGWRPRDHGDLSKYHYWCNIVNTYTRAKLTFPGDKLIALSAVAKAVRVLLQDSYVAGMWRRSLVRELLWSVAIGEAQARPSVYRAPSWSWAAVDGHITPGIMDVEAVEMLIEVQDLHLDYVTSDTTGLISGGWLQLWGSLKTLELLPDALFSSHSNSFEFLMMVVNGVPVSVRADSVMREYQPHVYLDDNQQLVSTQNHRPELFCMPARTRPGDDGSIYVLLLQLEDRKDGIFRRIGIARGWGKELRESLLASNAEESTLSCVKYEGGRHLVRIV